MAPCFDEREGIEATMRAWHSLLDREPYRSEIVPAATTGPPTDAISAVLRRRSVRTHRALHACAVRRERRQGCANRPLNVGTGEGTTVNEVARPLLEALVPVHAAPAPGELRAVAHIALARRLLAYRPSRLSLDLASVVEDFTR